MYLLPSARAALQEFEAWLRGRFALRLCEFSLYGSRTSESAREGPRLDLLVVISGLTADEVHELARYRNEVLARHGVVLSPLLVSTEQMAKLRAREDQKLVVESDETSM